MKVNGIELGPNSPAAGLRDCRSESAEEQLCDDHIARLSRKEAVVKFSQAQAAQQTRGISDRRYRVYGFAFWFEVKADDGKLTMSQHEFLLQELQSGSLALCGALADLKAFTTLLEIAQHDNSLREKLVTYCLDAVGTWAARGYRKERLTRRRR